AFSHGQVLSLLLAARLCQPTALINVPAWAADTGADLLWDLPPQSLNDDRLGRALDAFFTQRHSILTAVAAQPLHLPDLPRRPPPRHPPLRPPPPPLLRGLRTPPATAVAVALATSRWSGRPAGSPHARLRG